MMITVQTTGRMFRFLPTPRVVATIWYCFAVALLGFNIDIHEFSFLSNHFHIVMTPREANLPAFMQKLNSLLSRSLNALRGERGSNIEDHYNITVEVDEEAIWRQCAYTLANPCAADLVSRIKHWRGPNSFSLEYGEEITVEKPIFGLWRPADVEQKHRKPRKRRYPWDRRRRSFRGRSVLPDKAGFTLVRPPVGKGRFSDKAVREKVRARALARQRAAEERRKRQGRKALGMRRVLQQSWRDTPHKRQEMFGPEPKVAASSVWARKEAAQRSRTFQAGYQHARAAWEDGDRHAVFPAGTYKMRCRFDVCCAPAPPG